MSFIRALFSGVSGLKGHQTMMDVIGNNIANINTVGFKAGRATFADTFSQSLQHATSSDSETRGGANPIQVGLGSGIGSIDNLFAQGNMQSTGLNTDLAVEGKGLFAVRNGNELYYSRAGNFSLDSQGKLIHSASGSILQGMIADQFGLFPNGTNVVDGIIPGEDLDDVVINPSQNLQAKQTSTIVFDGNLDMNAALDSTITTTTPIFDSMGNQWNLTVLLTKTTAASDGGQQTWTVSVVNATRETDDPAATVAGRYQLDIGEDRDIIFNEDGSINDDGWDQTDPDDVLEIDFNEFGAGTMKLKFSFGTENTDSFDAADPATWGPYDGVTGFAGTTSFGAKEQDGYTSGVLDDFFIDTFGKVVGKFSNGQTQTLAQVILANFDNETGLDKLGSNLFAQTSNSGDPTFGAAGVASSAKIHGGTLEQSNVDLTEEFTNLIVAQRGFQANAKIITTSDEMIQDLLNVKR